MFPTVFRMSCKHPAQGENHLIFLFLLTGWLFHFQEMQTLHGHAQKTKVAIQEVRSMTVKSNEENIRIISMHCN